MAAASFLIVAIASLTRDSENNQNAIIYGIIISTLITLLFSWIMWLKTPVFSKFAIPMLHLSTENQSIVNRNFLGFILSPGIGLSLAKMIIDKKKSIKIICFILFLLFSISSLLTFSKGAWLSLLIPITAIMLIIVIDNKFSFLKKMIIGISIPVTFLIIQIISLSLNNSLLLSIQARLDSNFNSTRLEFLFEAIRISLEYPLLGIGPQAYQAIQYLPIDPHNAILGMSSEIGIIAASLMTLILFINFKSIIQIKNKNKSDKWLILFFFYLSLLIHIPLQGLPFSLKYLWILFGLIHSIRFSKSTIKNEVTHHY